MQRTVFCLLLAALSAVPARAEVVVRGFLTAGGAKVAGAAVRLAAAPEAAQAFEMAFAHPSLKEVAAARSDRDGSFELAAPEQGFYQVQVDAEGYLGTDRWVPALGAAAAPVSIELIRGRPVRLRALGEDGQPVAGARLRLGFDKDGAGRYPTWPLFRETGADGRLSFLVPQGQDAAAVLAAPGYAVTVVALPAGRESVEARLERGLPLEVEVQDPRRRFLSGVAVFAPDTLQEIGRTGRDGKASVRIGAGQRSLGFADAEGRRAIEVLPPAAAAPAVSPAAPSLGAPGAGEPAARTLRVVLDDPQPVEGQVLDLPERLPLAGAWVYSWGSPPHFSRSDRNGYFTLLTSPFRRGVGASLDGYRSTFAEAGTPPFPLLLALEPAAAVSGRVTDAAGEPVAGAWVTATSESASRTLRFGGRSRALTDREGRYAIDDLATRETAEIEATHEQLKAKAALAPLAAGDTARVDLRLPRRESWRCRVVGPDEKPIAGAEVFVAAPRLGGRLPPLDLARLEQAGLVRRLGATDGEGGLSTTELSAGRYDIAARATGYGFAWQRSVTVGAGEAAAEEVAAEAGGAGEAAETIVLQPLVRAQGKVLDEGGAPVEGATLHLALGAEGGGFFRAGPESPPVATSGAGGEFSFADVSAGQRFNLIAGKDGYVSAQLADQVLAPPGREQPPLILRLGRAGTVAGLVASDGEPVVFANVQIHPLEPPPRSESITWGPVARTDAEGGFSIGRLWPGRYRLEVEANGFQSWSSDPFTVAAGERKQLDVELERGALVVGKVLLANGTPVPDAWVSLAENGSTRGVASRADRPTDVLGQYRIDSAKPGARWLEVTSDRYRRQGRAVDVAAGVNQLDFVLETGSLEIAGRVIDTEGQPIAGARVLLQGDSVFREEKSGPEGELRFADLDPGTFRLEPSAPGYLGEPQSLELESSRRGVVFRLREARSRIAGLVQGLDPAELSAVRIQVRPAGSPEAASTNTAGAVPDNRGRYAVEGLAAGTWLLSASLPAPHRLLIETVEIAEAQQEANRDLDFGRLAGPHTIRLLDNGQPLSGYFFTLSQADLGPLLQSRGQGDRIEIHADPGPYHLEVFAMSAPEKRKALEIEIGPPQDQTLDLAPTP